MHKHISFWTPLKYDKLVEFLFKDGNLLVVAKGSKFSACGGGINNTTEQKGGQ
jgi:hypothetical protein